VSIVTDRQLAQGKAPTLSHKISLITTPATATEPVEQTAIIQQLAFLFAPSTTDLPFLVR